MLHDRTPVFSKAGGLPFAIAVFALGDEGLSSALRISPPPQKFPLAVHMRGFVGHVVYTAAVDGVYRFLKSLVDVPAFGESDLLQRMRTSSGSCD